jgi:6-phosphogluconolactonase
MLVLIKRGPRIQLCPLISIGFLVSILVGCGSGAAVSVSTPPTSTPSTAKPKFAYTGNQGASLSGYSVDPSTGSLMPLTGFPFALGISPQYVTHDPQNRFLIVSDISASMLHVFAINATTGALSEVSPSPYNTMIESENVVVDPSGTHVYLYRTGSSTSYPGVSGNQIVAFNLSSTGQLSPVQGSPFPVGAPGAAFDSTFGMVMDARGKYLYLKDSIHLYTFGIDATTGGLSMLQTQTAQQFGGIAVDPGGLYLYVAGQTLLQSYSIDPASGLLSLTKSTSAAQGAYTIALSLDGTHAYTVGGNILVSYALSNGVFTAVGSPYTGAYGQQIVVDPSGSYAYVPQTCSYCPGSPYNVVYEFSIAKTGALTPLATPTVASGVTPWSFTVTSQ